MSHAVGEVVKIVLLVAIALAAFTTGLGAHASGSQSIWRHPGQLARALLAILVAVPLWAFAFLEILPLPQSTRSGIFLAVLAVGIGPVAGMKRLQGDSLSVNRAFELNVTMLLVSIVYVPLMVALLAAVFHRDNLSLSVAAVAKIVLLRALIPLGIGLIVAHASPRSAEKLRGPLGRAVNIVVGLIVVVALVVSRRQLASAGLGGWLAALGVAAGAVAIGHLMGGPAEETRAPLASAATIRFPALALLLVNVAPLGQRLVPALLAYIASALIAVAVYGRVIERRRHTTRPTGPAQHAPRPAAA
jgi:bile acid:Na+ symporter, BASS family